MDNANATRSLGAFAAGLTRERIPADQFTYVRKSLLDWLGCCLAGTREPAVRSLNEVLEVAGGDGPATVIARGRRATVLDAALLNGAAGNLLDLDDVHPQLIGHPSSVIAPTLLTLAEWKGLDGARLATAWVAGYEAMVRLGLATEPELYDRGWHATGALGVFGSCAAAANLLRLDEDQATAALAIAAAQAAGLRELFGTSSKCIHHGKAAMAGILACLWAAKGVESAADVLGGRYGLRTLSEPVRLAAVTDGLGERFHLAQTCYKRHAACGSVHAAIDAALQLRTEPGFDVDRIERIDVTTHLLSVSLTAHNEHARTAYEAKYSMHYSLALAFLEGRGDLEVFTDARVNDPRVRALAQRVHMRGDPEMQYVEAMPSQVVVQMKDGRRHALRVDAPKGRPSNPMDWNDMADKFRRLAAPTLSDARARQVIERVEALDTLDVRGLMELLR
jgi:2-methylcitrate dehydratase PrpD